MSFCCIHSGGEGLNTLPDNILKVLTDMDGLCLDDKIDREYLMSALTDMLERKYVIMQVRGRNTNETS